MTGLEPGPVQGFWPDRIAVILSGDKASSSLEIYAWMVHSTMTEFQLVRLRSRSKGKYLSPKADSHHRQRGLHQCLRRLDRVPALTRVSGSVTDDYPCWSVIEYLIGWIIVRYTYHRRSHFQEAS